MGTNYYWHDQPCEHCGRYEDIHVGKSGFTWRGYQHRLFNEEHPDWGYDPQSPLGFPVLSVQDWRKVFTERPGQLFDEYGRQVDDPIKWLSEIKPPDVKRRADIDRWERGMGWYDEEGFYFIGQEFS